MIQTKTQVRLDAQLNICMFFVMVFPSNTIKIVSVRGPTTKCSMW